MKTDLSCVDHGDEDSDDVDVDVDTDVVDDEWCCF